jgi:hypothetical protein
VLDIVCFTWAERDPTIKRLYEGTRWVREALFAKRPREIPPSTARQKPSLKSETRQVGPTRFDPTSTSVNRDGE